jgi:hypothetical protein
MVLGSRVYGTHIKCGPCTLRWTREIKT